MFSHNRQSVYSALCEQGLLPLYYNPDPEICRQVIASAFRGGVRAFEFTNRGAFAHCVFSELKKWAQTACPSLLLGVGSVVDAPTAALYMQAGADFIVSPMLNADIFRVCNRRQVAHIAGCSTLSEMGLAQELGAEIVKLFPGEVLQPAFLKAALAPMPWSKIMVTGGVTPQKENLQQWFSAGAVCVGMGSKLFSTEVIKLQQWDTIETLCRQTLQTIACLRA
jgi:2-dehydro-3-deoxyphosphogluconate aldolase/(4S)-4-hydroxy-2-oxoglutarate aldolase